MSAELAKRLNVVELVAEYDRCVAQMRAACEMIASAEDALNAAFCTTDDSSKMRLSSDRRFSFDHSEDQFMALRRQVWGRIVERTEVQRMLSCARARELREWLEKGELPEVTVTNVQTMVGQFATQLPEMLAEAVKEVFDLLRPPRSIYRTNTELELGDKVVLSYWLDDTRFGGLYHTSYRNPERFTALENVFKALDGKGQMTKGYRSDLATAINATRIDGDGRGETEYFAFRCFKKGTLHIRFKRPDLVAKLNQIAGGKNLRPGAAA